MSLSVHCPECHTPLEVDEEHRDWKVRCPQCRHEFRPLDAASAPGVFEVVADGEEPAPRRRPRRRRRDEDDGDPRNAVQDVSAPATALKVLGWMGLGLSALGVLLWVFILTWAANDPQAKKNMGKDDEIFVEGAVYITQGVVAGIVSIFILIGAGKMSRLENRSWAMTAAVLGSIPCISPCCLLGLPFGIWAIAVLNRPSVQAAFRRRARQSNPDDHEDEEDDR